jgi:hypothetical protein
MTTPTSPFLGGQFEELLDELNLRSNVSAANPPGLPFRIIVHRLISLNRSPCRLAVRIKNYRTRQRNGPLGFLIA